MPDGVAVRPSNRLRRADPDVTVTLLEQFSLDSRKPYDRVLRDTGWPQGLRRGNVPCLVLLLRREGRGDDHKACRVRGEGGLAIVRPSNLFRKSVPGKPSAPPEAPHSAAADSARLAGKPTGDLPTPEPLDQPDAPYHALARQEVGRILEAVAAGNAFEIGALQRIVAGMANSILSGDELLVHALIDDDTAYDLSRHMTNTAVFAIKMGHGAGCRTEELPWLGLAACLHDVGMTIVPKRILDNTGPLTADETALVRRHPEQGFRILQTLGASFEWLANVALQEHEREDGSGYPKALREDEIHEYAKIIGLADAYESLTHFRPYRNKRSAIDAVKELITTQRTRFPDSALKGLIRGLSTFPVGSHVRLNTMEIARIVATNPAFPLRPIIEIVAGSRGERLASPRRLDLSTNTLLYVTEAWSGKILG